jgi:hypothetical protein
MKTVQNRLAKHTYAPEAVIHFNWLVELSLIDKRT